MCIYVRVYIYICVHLYICMYIYMYIVELDPPSSRQHSGRQDDGSCLSALTHEERESADWYSKIWKEKFGKIASEDTEVLYICIYKHLYINVYVHMRMQYMCIYSCMHAYPCVYVYVLGYKHGYVCVTIHMFTYICIYMYIHMAASH